MVKKNYKDPNYYKDLFHFRELFIFMVWRDLKVRYKQTILGIAWAVIQPLASTLVFFLLFGKLAKMPSDGIPYPVFTYLGMMAWTYFSGSITYASNSLVNNRNLISKVYFPRLILPGAGVLSLMPDFFIATLVGIGLMAYAGICPEWGILLWPFLAVLTALISLGVSLILSALNVRFRDVKYVIPFLIQIWLFLTPIIYPTSIVPEKFRFLSYLNPMAGVIDAFRASALPGKDITWGSLGISLAIGTVIFIIGLTIFNRAERQFADII
jgi:lipopolysaccharide transport system permease protein